MGAQPAGQGSPPRATAKAAAGVTILSDRSASEGVAKWWDPVVLEAPVARPSHWDIREPDPLPLPFPLSLPTLHPLSLKNAKGTLSALDSAPCDRDR